MFPYISCFLSYLNMCPYVNFPKSTCNLKPSLERTQKPHSHPTTPVILSIETNWNWENKQIKLQLLEGPRMRILPVLILEGRLSIEKQEATKDAGEDRCAWETSEGETVCEVTEWDKEGLEGWFKEGLGQSLILEKEF